MFENIEQAADALANKNAGWVVRRDGASNLGYAAGKALAALKAYEDEKDVDVRRAIDKALGEASNALAGVPPRFPESRKHTLEELVRACEKPGKREVKPHDDGFLITVALGERRQTVYVMPLKRKDGMELIRIYTFCGPLDEKTGMWALKTNPKLVQ
ncbi:MAG TPA: hypothetical protein ENN80_15520 [Candidatus Hydrogenedentes bacterium]|nr:hypothetical protein [Candidatus Hydrogenedentota bacterium]